MGPMISQLTEALRRSYCEHNDELEEILQAIDVSYDSEFTNGAEPAVDAPFVIGDVPIEALLNFAIKNPSKSENLLVLLANMGTAVLNSDHYDNLIGRRDPRLETAIINKALTLQQSKVSFSSKKIIYGLSGNPPTENHKRFINYLCGTNDSVTVVLNAQSPLKAAADYAPANCRMDMLEAIMSPKPDNLTISSVEINRSAPSRMVVTASILSLLSGPKEALELVLGMDALSTFPKWYEYEKLGRICSLKFYSRQGEDAANDPNLDVLKSLSYKGMNIHIVLNPEQDRESFVDAYTKKIPVDGAPLIPFDITFASIPDLSDGSATKIRNWVQSDDCKAWYELNGAQETVLTEQLAERGIPRKVFDYIINHSLYNSKVSKPEIEDV